jgi:F-type H+-transporting ATPase subunit gamma
MANLKEVRERITSVISTQQITKAMKMVSAAKFRRAQMAIVQMRPYSNRLQGMLSNILSNLDGDAATTFGDKRPVQSALLVVVTSNRGLCGAFNTYIIKAAQQSLLSPEMQQARANGKLSVMCIGKKGYEFFRRQSDLNMISNHVDLFSTLNFEAVKGVANEIMDGFETKQYDHVVVCYGQFKNAATQEPTAVDFLPVSLNAEAPKEKGKKAEMKADYIFMPDKERLLEEIVPGILQTTFYRFLLDTHASEHGARMTAMDKATENANDMLRDLRINYNKARQEAITKELSEIVGGAAALGG